MNSIPTESLVRIFRYLPPQTFFGLISRVSGLFRDVAAIAIPGCQGPREVAIACHVIFVNDPMFQSSPEPWGWSDTFSEFDWRHGNRTIWSGLRASIRIPLHDTANGLCSSDLLGYITQPRSEVRPSFKFIIKEADVSYQFSNEFHDNFGRAVRNIVEFIHSNRTRHLKVCAKVGFYKQLKVLLPDLPKLPHIDYLFLRNVEKDDENESEDESEGEDTIDVGLPLEVLLHLCPEVHHILGCDMIDRTASIHLVQTVPESIRTHVVSYDDNAIYSHKRNNLFTYVPRVFPNIRRLGTFLMWGGQNYELDFFARVRRRALARLPRQVLAPSVHELDIEIWGTDLKEVGLTENLVEWIFTSMLALNKMRIRVALVGPEETYEEVPGTDEAVLAFLESLFRFGKTHAGTFYVCVEVVSLDEVICDVRKLYSSTHPIERAFKTSVQDLAQRTSVTLFISEIKGLAFI